MVQGMVTSNYQEVILANSAVIDFNDPIKIDSSGFLDQVGVGEKIQGFYAEARKTVTADNQTVAKVKGRYQPVADGMVLEMTADQACTDTDLGAYADIAVSGNAFTVNLAAGGNGQLEIIDYDPNRDGSTTLVRAVVAEPQALAFAQA
jgi:hypothetical protein